MAASLIGAAADGTVKAALRYGAFCERPVGRWRPGAGLRWAALAIVAGRLDPAGAYPVLSRPQAQLRSILSPCHSGIVRAASALP